MKLFISETSFWIICTLKCSDFQWKLLIFALETIKCNCKARRAEWNKHFCHSKCRESKIFTLPRHCFMDFNPRKDHFTTKCGVVVCWCAWVHECYLEQRAFLYVENVDHYQLCPLSFDWNVITLPNGIYLRAVLRKECSDVLL